MKYYRVERFFYTHHMKLLSRLIFRLIYLQFNCYIPPSASIGKGSVFPHGIGIVIHHKAVIGDNCTIYQNVTIGGGDNIVIGNNCVIGCSASIIGGNLIIGNGVTIGANTFVNFSVPDGSLVVGSKGKIVRSDS